MRRLEQVTDDFAAGGTIGVEADKDHTAVIGFDMRRRQHPANGRRIAVEIGQVLPCRFLHRMVIGHREGHQLVESHFLRAVKGDEVRIDDGQLETLAHDGRGHAEAGRDFLRPLAVLGKRVKRLELVGGVHRFADDVLGQADLARILVVEDIAGNRLGLGDVLALRQQLESSEPPPSRHYLELALRAVPHLQVLQQTMRVNAGGKLVNADGNAGLANIGR
jgi:hypothetical protein